VDAEALMKQKALDYALKKEKREGKGGEADDDEEDDDEDDDEVRQWGGEGQALCSRVHKRTALGIQMGRRRRVEKFVVHCGPG
jgi:hypothetical protein